MFGSKGARVAPAIGLAIAVVFMSAVVTFAGEGPKIGAKIDNFTLVDVHENQAVSLTDFDEAKALVLLFVATQCPVSNDYNERMAQLYVDYAEKPVQFIGINSNKQEAFQEVLEHAQKNELAFPVLKDMDNKIADVFAAQFTPEVYVLQVKQNGGGPEFVLKYHGAIDDSQKVANIQHHYLRDTLNAMLEGKDVPKTETKAFGCTIKRVEKGSGFAAP